MLDDEVLDLAGRFASEHAATDAQARLIALAMQELRARLQPLSAAGYGLHSVHVPRLVFMALTGEEARVRPLLVALTLLHTGIDLLDDVMDGDASPSWQGYRPAELSLAAMSLGAALAPLALANLQAPPVTVVALQRRLAHGLLIMSAGQQRDLALTGDGEPDPSEVEDIIMMKSGEEVAICAALAALLAEAPPAIVDGFASMGRALGMMEQLRSECADLVVGEHSRDLAAGTRTLPITLCLAAARRDQRAQLVALLKRARDDGSAQQAVRRRLQEAGILHACAVLVELYAQRARDALERTGVRGPAATELRRMIHSFSLFRPREAATRISEGGGES